MPVAMLTASHSPLMGAVAASNEVEATVSEAIGEARQFVQQFAPEAIVIFGPDHYNGFFYDLMPPFCIGLAATSVGDYGLPSGPLNVDSSLAMTLIRGCLSRDVDVAFSERMQVDHGLVQGLTVFADLDTPLVPIFVNSVAAPLSPVRRTRQLGTAIGKTLAQDSRRILVFGSGGLSHDPPVPRREDAPPEVAEKLIAGRNPTSGERQKREARVRKAGEDFAAGALSLQPLNPAWDAEIMRTLADGDFATVDSWSNDWFEAEGGGSSHEVRTWIATYAAMHAAQGHVSIDTSFYTPVNEWIAGFGITRARP